MCLGTVNIGFESILGTEFSLFANLVGKLEPLELDIKSFNP